MTQYVLLQHSPSEGGCDGVKILAISDNKDTLIEICKNLTNRIKETDPDWYNSRTRGIPLEWRGYPTFENTLVYQRYFLDLEIHIVPDILPNTIIKCDKCNKEFHALNKAYKCTICGATLCVDCVTRLPYSDLQYCIECIPKYHINKDDNN